MARAPDVPKISMLEVPIYEPDAPFGAKEASECSITGILPAIVSAIHDATGVWVTDLPVTPEKLLKAMEEKRKGSMAPMNRPAKTSGTPGSAGMTVPARPAMTTSTASSHHRIVQSIRYPVRCSQIQAPIDLWPLS